ncbi:DNA repair protein RAD51 homolog 2-like [Saccostrea echinata]|uniref:DNA repair protein RAD51 homolog 2-like n=1 Tax=Saccostrea echinata TaxID=191078 RepID=UPI002A8262AE|nr:DNA repair protein RAD51 homolog 2-like [Saccostrea echinata]
MSSKKLRRIRCLSGDIIERLAKNNVNTCKDVLSKSDLELLKILGVGIFTIHHLQKQCSLACVPQCLTSLELLEKKKKENVQFFPTSLCDLDFVLHGGVPMGTVTEIAGPSGCGKTQFCTMLSVLATLPRNRGGLGGKVLYIDTESAFSAERLVEIAQNKYPDLYNSDDELCDMAQKVLVDNHQTCASLIKKLETLEEEVIAHKIRLIIVDSIASLVRKEFSSGAGTSLVQRTNFLSRQAALLKYVAEVFCIPVIVTNQITTRFSRQASDQDEESTEFSEGYVTVALGNTWSHNVNTRLILQYLNDNKRQVMVAKSPVAPFTVFNYTIQKDGIIQDAEGAGLYAGTDPGIQQISVRTSLPFQNDNHFFTRTTK